MRLARLSRSRPDDVPAQHIAALLEVWLAGDGGLRRTRERAKVHQQVREYTLQSWTTDYWDFGVTAEIAVPAPEQILGGPDGPDVSTS